MFVRDRTARRHRDQQGSVTVLGRGLLTLLQSCPLQAGCLARPPVSSAGRPCVPLVCLSTLGNQSYLHGCPAFPMLAACSSILASTLSSSSQPVSKQGRELGTRTTEMDVPG